MARESTITQEQVNAAADGLRAADIKPTVRAVRERLGTGSMATVNKMLQVWQSGQVRPAETPITLPAGLQRTLVDFVAQAVAAGKADLAAELAELQQVNADLASESERQALALAALEDDLAAASRERDVQAGRARQLTGDLQTVREDAAREREAAEGARTELAKAQLRLEAMPRLEADLERLRAELEAERAGRVAAEQAAAVAAARLEGERSARAHLEAELASAGAREAKAADQARAALDQVGELTRRLAEERLGRVKADKALQKANESQQQRLRSVRAGVRKPLNADAPADGQAEGNEGA